MLFDRLYTGLPAEIDALAEKIVATFGVAAVDSVSQIGITTAVLRRWSAETGLISRALVAEKDLQEAVESTLTEMRATGEISNGMEDFLQALANAHETNLYLLKQRMTPAGKLASRYLRQI
jgi:DNA-binding ferritin-like protein